MSLKARLVLLSTFWLVFIIMLFNIFTYFFVLNISTKREIQLLWKKIDTILTVDNVRNPANWGNEHLLDEFLLSGELIRIVGTSGSVVNQVYSNDKLLAKPVRYSPEYKSKIDSAGEARLLFVQAPITYNGNTVGMLEIGSMMNLLNENLDVLVSALMLSTGGAIFLSVVGGYWYTRFLFTPIRELAETMHKIQESGSFRRLDPEYASKTDELGKLGFTFNEMIGRLENNFVQQKQFVEDASHELRTPLTIIESYAKLLERWAADDPALRDEAIEAIVSETKRLKGLINSLLVLVQADRDTAPEREPVNIAAIARSVASSMRLSFQRDIQIEAEDDIVEVEGVSEKLRQLLIILIDNALKYSSKPVTVRVESTGALATIEVTDQGIGIESSEIPFIFDRFYRVDRARSRKTGGTGLGLSIAKKIVEMHSGTIGIESEIGTGTTVIVRIPRFSNGVNER